MPKYTVIEPLGYDRLDPYMPGETVDMDEATAVGLIEVGIIAPPAVANEKTLKAADAIAKAGAAASLDELADLEYGETRPTVLAAIDARRKELA